MHKDSNAQRGRRGTAKQAGELRNTMAGFYLQEYARTTDGFLNVVEVLIGFLLWALYWALGATTWSEQFLHSAAFAVASNGGIFLLSSSFSIPTALMMPRMCYYSTFHLVAAACYVFGGVGSLRNSSFVDGLTATIGGAFHTAHFVYSLRGPPLQLPPS
ncbi:uncharacterized protein LOC144100517 [Amblyomma americanum]